MKTFKIYMLLALLCSAWFTASFAAKPERMSVSVTTYNLLSRQFVHKSPWEDRKQQVGKIIRQENHNPDILGCEESQDEVQMNDMIAMLSPEYAYREMGIGASPRIIFWRKARFELVESDNIDLLNIYPEYAPDEYLTSRYANFVRLREKSSGHELLVYLVHVKSGGKRSNEYQLLRRQCIQSLCRVAKAKSDSLGGMPVIAMGDLNNYAKTVINGVPSAPMTFVENGFADTFDLAAEHMNAGYKTYSPQSCIDEGTATPAGVNDRLDYIFVYPPKCAEVRRWAAIINFLPGSDVRVEKPIPSDHHPVNARLVLNY